MSGKPFLDTNIIVYAFSVGDPRSAVAEALIAAGGHISVQALNEFVAVARRKQQRSWEDIETALGVLDVLLEPPQPLTHELHRTAVQLARRDGFSIYDALIVAGAMSAGCTVLLSEDLQDGRRVESLTIRNPFAL